ncbi:MAG: 3-hydroxyacyl-ACP dehydratase FabZ [Gracilibacteraceae bacterium]|jgi:3-hydroxyacyl-[acyl-carrier-protein] dehydratase|nr:3-hydroxyacyl-ACP dehydratase FabZ [Gracilibacteraceae bacterium]
MENSPPAEVLSFDIVEIQAYQQNRYPYLFIDRITECVPGKYAKGFKNLTMNEWFFPPHFVDNPVMPGAILVEAMAQVALMTHLTLPGNKGKLVTGIVYNNVRLRKQIRPGDRIDFAAELLSYRRGLAKIQASGHVGGELAIDGELIQAYPDVVLSLTPGGSGRAG